ncbi:hypothetical protein U1Q18_039264 [Sarracenia purpurea var. burkii]
MGKYMRKCKGIGEIEVMEVAHVGVMTRARALAMAAAASSGTGRRRKICGGELKLSSSLVELRSRSRVVVAPEISVSTATSGNSGRRMVSNDRCSSQSSENVPASCCLSNGSSDLAKKSFKILDLEEDSSVQVETSTTSDFYRRERRGTTPSSDLQPESVDMESTARPSDANSRRKSSAEKTSSDKDLEEFFAAAEKDLQKRFAEKYNYDIVNDVPLKGRYDWVRLKP